jgi:hypothetical protein
MVFVIRLLGLLLTWGPIVLSAIKRVETILGNKPGDEKKKAAVELIREAFSIKGIEFDDNANAMVSGLIDLIVSSLNAWKGWKKTE